MTTMVEIGYFLDSPAWTPAEKLVIKWQFHLYGDFYTALWEVIKRADEENLERLACGFPLQIIGFKQWAFGDLGQRLRAAGLEI